MAEENIDINTLDEDINIIDGIDVAEELPDVEHKETIEIIEVTEVDPLAVSVDHAFSALGEPNTELRHTLMTGRDISDQHPITAITGLRKELDTIEALQTVYSDKKGSADYYLWYDSNPLQEDRVGYFVAIGDDTSQIKLCTENDDMLGVTVDSSAFIGGQNDVARGADYGLVASSGVVGVRCETNIIVGDTVIPNNYGYARKSDSKYGYKVIEIHDITSVPFAIIKLGDSIRQTDLLSQEIDALSDRMDDAEINITAAVNTANEAHQKAMDTGELSEEAILRALEALDKSNATSDKVDEFGDIIVSSDQTAAKAKEIASLAATSAEAMRYEALEKANDALTEAVQTKEEIEKKVSEMRTEVDGSFEEIVRIQNEITPITEWTDGTRSGVVGYVARADENATTLAGLVEWQDETNESIAGFKQEVSQNYATTQQLVAVETYTTTAVSTLRQEATDTYATKEDISVFVDEEKLSTAVAGVKQYVDDETAEFDILLSYENGENKGVSGLMTQVNQNKSTLETLTSFDGDLSETLAKIEQKADANGASIQLLTANIDKYSVGEYSQAYGLTLDQAKSTLEVGIIYVPTVTHNETYSDTTRSFTKGFYYTWDGAKWVASNSESVKFSDAYVVGGTSSPYWYIPETSVSYEGLTYEAKTLYEWQSNKWVAVATLAGNLSSRKMSLIRQTQDGIAIDVSNLKGDYAGLAVRVGKTESQVQQVASWEDRIATVETKANDTSAAVSLVVEKKNGQNVVKAASIVTAINEDDTSSITLDADKINLNGAITANGTFKIDKNGFLTATGGTIGGWTIGDQAIYKDKFGFSYAGDGTYIGTDGIAQTYGDGSYVKIKNGAITANSADITGKITATNGSIGGWTIDGDVLKSTSALANGSKSALFLNGNPAQNNTGKWIEANDDSGTEMFSVGYNGSVYARNLFLGNNAVSIKPYQSRGAGLETENADGDLKALCQWAPGWIYMAAAGLVDGAVKNNSSILCTSSTTDDASYMELYTTNGYLNGSWSNGSPIATASDINKKNTIAIIDEKYNSLFDGLKSSTYKYNDGTSDRLHVGFIAQDVKQAMDESGVDSQEFAGLVVKNNQDGTQDWYLRYEEFIALNTWQIQKAKARITELENKILKLENIINKEN